MDIHHSCQIAPGYNQTTKGSIVYPVCSDSPSVGWMGWMAIPHQSHVTWPWQPWHICFGYLKFQSFWRWIAVIFLTKNRFRGLNAARFPHQMPQFTQKRGPCSVLISLRWLETTRWNQSWMTLQVTGPSQYHIIGYIYSIDIPHYLYTYIMKNI